MDGTEKLLLTKQIPTNLANGVCPTLMATAFAKARVSYFLGGAKVWAYPAVLTIKPKEK